MYYFCRDELMGVYGRNLGKFLKGKLGVCSKCGSQNVRVSRWWNEMSGELISEVSCGNGIDCNHNVRRDSIELVLNEWNDENINDKCANVIIV